ncbi:DUF1593 domain-containing protein [Mucilaginibacter mali]|uniref:DUF1593 domain-containing protein n=1 Tax=Mucilaginibacter mali TaxID=2740462 RepID=A0A7D4TS60_9SPHI|nr:nucleoside hydrolase-like domain-containing protein [Mucilaginibacter mali]QKJ32574.1 DUF1593 domain-containing protein [Mucilaginibacter mali]
MIFKVNIKAIIFACLCFILTGLAYAQQPVPVKPRILISTDIGGTDPDDNQSMIHFLIYSHLFDTEGLVSSPSYGAGNKEEILKMIGLYEKDLPKLQQHQKGYPTPDALRAICKQGRKGAAPYKGYLTATEGSDWIIKCAKKEDTRPLWVLVWGGLEDVAQALHDAPEIASRIRVYWIGGPNKKWSANSYAYIAANFPKLWFIECNSSYYGFFSGNGSPENLKPANYYNNFISNAGYMGAAFKSYYKGIPKMGDTPSLLYMMDGDPKNPLRESWGGSFIKFNHSARIVYDRATTITDTVPTFSTVEFHFKGPKINISPDSACFTLTMQAGIGEQKWDGFYNGNGDYVIRYCPKQTETLNYKVSSKIPGFEPLQGKLVISNLWPGQPHQTDYRLGSNWYTDKPDASLYDGIWQGSQTVLKWRSDIMLDWGKRWAWLK